MALEPLGIFQFLQSLMHTDEKNEENPPKTSEENPQEQTQTEQNTQAIMDFLSAPGYSDERTLYALKLEG